MALGAALRRAMVINWPGAPLGNRQFDYRLHNMNSELQMRDDEYLTTLPELVDGDPEANHTRMIEWAMDELVARGEFRLVLDDKTGEKRYVPTAEYAGKPPFED